MDPAKPLRNTRHEAFAQSVASGSTLKDAYAKAGFKAKDATQSGYWLRRRPEVNARIEFLMKCRVEASNRSFVRRQKTQGDLLARALQKLDDIMSADIGEIVDWRREPVLNSDGEVVEIAETIQVKDARAIPAKSRAAIRSVFTKGGALRVDLHDQRAAAEAIVKLLSGKDAQPASVTNNTTINAVNVGQMPAVEAAQRVAFLIAAAARALPTASAPAVIEAKPLASPE